MPYFCLHIPLSLLLLCSFFPCMLHSNNQAWLFFLAHISQTGTEMGIFPSSWWYNFRSCGRFKEMAALLCFLGAGCGPLLCLARAQQLLRQAQEHLGHPRSVLPTCAYSHRVIKVGGGQLTRVQGSGPNGMNIFALCQCGSKQSSKAASFTNSTGRYPTTNTYSGAGNAANSASRCYIKAEQGDQNMEREKQKQHRQGRTCVCVCTLGVKYTFTLA